MVELVESALLGGRVTCSMISLAGRTALVTGGSRGIGRATALLLARAGADVALTFHARAADAEASAAEIRALGPAGAHRSAGTSPTPTSWTACAESVRRAFGRLDCFVANAGIWPPDEVPLTAHSRPTAGGATMAANLDAVFLSTRAALGSDGPGWARRHRVEHAGQRGEAFHSDYAATKGAVIALTKSLAIECAPDILVNCVAPGWVDTEMCIPAFAGDGRERVRRHHPPPPHPAARGHRRADPVSVQRPRASRDRRGPQRERGERPVRLSGA